MTLKTTAVFKPFACESNVVTFNGRLIVLYTPRTPHEEGLLLAVDYFSGEVIAKVPNHGLLLGSAVVVPAASGDTLHFYGTQSVGLPGNSIWHMTTSDPALLNWSSHTKVWQAAHPQQKIFNTAICKDPVNNRYFMAYETSEPYYGHVDFNIRWFVSTDLYTWRPYGGIFGPDRYVACPWMRYSNGYFYMVYLVAEGTGWKSRIARATDPAGTWVESPKVVVSATYPSELINASDWDCEEFEGIVYACYATGDQNLVTDLRQMIITDSMAGFLASFFS